LLPISNDGRANRHVINWYNHSTTTWWFGQSLSAASCPEAGAKVGGRGGPEASEDYAESQLYILQRKVRYLEE
jgi:hypothetical protein